MASDPKDRTTPSDKELEHDEDVLILIDDDEDAEAEETEHVLLEVDEDEPDDSRDDEIELETGPSVPRGEWKTHQPDLRALQENVEIQSAEEQMETEWQEVEASSWLNGKTVAIMAILLVWVTLAVTFYVRGDSTAEPTDETAQQESGTPTAKAPSVRDAVVVPPITRSQEEEGRDTLRALKQAVRNFLAAETKEELVKHVRHPKRVAPFIEEYYSTQPLEPMVNVEFTDINYHTFGTSAMWVISVESTKGKTAHLLAEQVASDKILVDWETFVTHQPHDIDQLVAERPEGEFDIRCRIELGTMNVMKYRNDKEWLSLIATIPGRIDPLFLYVHRSLPEARALRTQAKRNARADYESTGSRETFPAIMRVRFIKDARFEGTVELIEWVSPTWAYMEDLEETEE